MLAVTAPLQPVAHRALSLTQVVKQTDVGFQQA